MAALLAILSGALFGAMAVAFRAALSRCDDAEAGTVAAGAVAFVLCCGIAVVLAGDGGARSWDALWPFALVGVIVPGASQMLYVRAIRDVGATRAAVLVGTTPMISVVLALLLLDESFGVVAGVGTALIVLASAAVAGERDRPRDFKAIGIALALLTALLFGFRDVILRAASNGEDAAPLVAAAVSLGTAAVVLVAWLGVVRGRGTVAALRRATPPFALAGALLAAAYATLVEAFANGPVTLVSPLYGTQSLWSLVFAAALMAGAEPLGRRIVGAAIIMVAGGALVGVAG